MELYPLCGGQVPDKPRVRVRAIVECLRLQPQARLIAEYLADKTPVPVSPAAIVDLLWGADPDGGPLAAEQAVRVQISRIRRAVAGSALSIETLYGRGWRLLLHDRREPDERAANGAREEAA